jgi:hypothetical protein
MRALDTSAKAAAIHDQLYDDAGPEGRFRMAMEISDLAHEFAKAGVKMRNPGLSEAEVVRELARLLYGR